MGRNCRFLQGRYTSRKTVKQIRDAVINGKQLDVEILNYRKDSVPFWNRSRIFASHLPLSFDSKLDFLCYLCTRRARMERMWLLILLQYKRM